MLGVPSFAKATWITKLAGMPVVHRAIRVFRVQQFAERALGIVPVRRKLKRSGLGYRVRFLESFLIADEIFSREIYREAFEERTVRTFVDIGSNVGYFPLFAVEQTGDREMTGLVIDANETMAKESRWHAESNALGHVSVQWGVAGNPPDVKSCTFYMNASNVASSAQPKLNPNVPAKSEPIPVVVPAIDVAGEWKKHAGNRRIDLLKIDVEGFECELIKNSTELLALTDRIVIEWHKWMTSLEEVESLLAARGFVRRKIISEDPHCGVAILDRVAA